ncbi:MAG: hypothetical protein AAB557_02635 [Patescibacteria group bacterium]
MADQVNWTAERAKEHNLPPQGKDESDKAFRFRISSALRDMGFPIEAHEAYCNALYDQSQDVLTALYGVVTQETKRDYGQTDGERVGDDIATGIVVRTPAREVDPMAMLLAAFLR